MGNLNSQSVSINTFGISQNGDQLLQAAKTNNFELVKYYVSECREYVNSVKKITVK